MADVQMIFGILLFLGIAFPGMMTAWWLLFPTMVERAEERLEVTPWKSFFLGLGVIFVMTIPLIILFSAVGGVGQFIGWLLIVGLLTISGIGAAGIAAIMGKRLALRKEGLSPAAAFVVGAVTLELAAVFPLVGWVIILPLAIITSVGATAFAILRFAPQKKSIAPESAETSPA